MTQQPTHDSGVFTSTPGNIAPGTLDMQSTPVTPTRTFGPIPATQQGQQPQQQWQQGQQPQQPGQGQDTNALLQQLLTQLAAQAQGGSQGGSQGGPAAPAAPAELSPEDQRLITTLAGIHTSGRDTKIVKRTTIGGGLYFVKYSYSPATGVPASAHALVYDDGTDAHVFGGM